MFIFSLESAAQQNVYENGRLGVILDKVERTDAYPSEWRTPGYRYLPPKDGHDYIVVHFTFEKIRNVHVVSLGGKEDEKSFLFNIQGRKYKLSTWNTKGWKYLYPDKLTSPAELIKGATGILIFEIPKNAQPAELSFIYYFKETWDDTDKQGAKIDIVITPTTIEQTVATTIY